MRGVGARSGGDATNFCYFSWSIEKFFQLTKTSPKRRNIRNILIKTPIARQSASTARRSGTVSPLEIFFAQQWETHILIVISLNENMRGLVLIQFTFLIGIQGFTLPMNKISKPISYLNIHSSIGNHHVTRLQSLSPDTAGRALINLDRVKLLLDGLGPYAGISPFAH